MNAITKFIQDNLELCENATEGTWDYYNRETSDDGVCVYFELFGSTTKLGTNPFMIIDRNKIGTQVADAQFIAHSRTALPQALKALKIAIKALNEHAAWSDGKTVGGHFDSPGDAKLARETLIEIEELLQ